MLFGVQIVGCSWETRPSTAEDAPVATGHLSGAIGAQATQLLLLLVFQDQTCAVIPAIPMLARLEFVFLPRFDIVNLTIKISLQLFAGIAGPRRRARCQNRRESQEGTDYDRARGPILSHMECLLDTQTFHRNLGQEEVLFDEIWFRKTKLIEDADSFRIVPRSAFSIVAWTKSMLWDMVYLILPGWVIG